jgi:phosphopantetheinyl transferase
MLKISYTNIKKNHFNDFRFMLDLLPKSDQKSILPIKLIESQVQKTIARILLRNELMKMGYGTNVLESIKKSNSGKPYLAGNINFSITHSHDLVAIAFCKNGNIGIDTEMIRPVFNNAFKVYFSDKDWIEIINSPKQNEMLLKKWTILEAYLKANNIGFNQYLGNVIELNYQEKKVYIGKFKEHYFDYVDLSSEYLTTYSCDKKIVNPSLEYVNIEC